MPKEFPANSMRGFARAADLGCTMVECDIRLSLDHKLVLAHDDYVIDNEGNRFDIAKTTAQKLAGLNLGAGEGVPALDDLVEWARNRCAVMADMKCSGGMTEQMTALSLGSLPQDMKIVPGADSVSRRIFREIDPLLPLSFSTDTLDGCGSSDKLSEFIASLDTAAVTWHYSLLTPERIELLKSANILVYAWTVDDYETMIALKKAGVDGIISNRADLLANL